MAKLACESRKALFANHLIWFIFRERIEEPFESHDRTGREVEQITRTFGLHKIRRQAVWNSFNNAVSSLKCSEQTSCGGRQESLGSEMLDPNLRFRTADSRPVDRYWYHTTDLTDKAGSVGIIKRGWISQMKLSKLNDDSVKVHSESSRVIFGAISVTRKSLKPQLFALEDFPEPASR